MNPILTTRFNWSYDDYLKELQNATVVVRNNTERIHFFLCSHPTVVTTGRSNQRFSQASEHLTNSAQTSLNGSEGDIETVKIKRGGGPTLHYPGQIIFYPVINLNRYKVSLKEIMGELLDCVSRELGAEFPNLKAKWKWEPLGIWARNKKIASIGMGLDHFVTQHGLALNVFVDESARRLIQRLSPCGLKPEVYSGLYEEVSLATFTTKEDFHKRVVALFREKILPSFSGWIYSRDKKA